MSRLLALTLVATLVVGCANDQLHGVPNDPSAATNACIVQCAPATLDLGATGVGSSNTATITCSGTTDASVIQALNSTTPASFSITGPGPGSTIAGAFSYRVVYSPTAEGPETGTFTITVSGCDDQVVTLQGTGAAVPVPVCIPPQTFEPVLKWAWSGLTSSTARDVLMTPIVINLTDDNGDGRIDTSDVPDVVFSTFDATQVGINGFDFSLPPGTLHVVSGKDGSELRTFTSPVEPGTSPAAADLDGDGVPEIVAIQHHGSGAASGQWRLIALHADGSTFWVSDQYEYDSSVTISYGQEYSAVSIADLDADGVPEVFVGSTVFDSRGHLLWQGTAGRADSDGGMFSTAADLDGDGKLEVVAGNTAYRADGSVLWTQPAVGDGSVAVADCDGDGKPEVFIMSPGLDSNVPMFAILNHDGTVRVPTTAGPGFGYWASTPAAGDLNGDGKAEWVASFQSMLAAIDCDGRVLWSFPTNDPSGISGPAVFDFEGDGALEVVFGDETSVNVYRGSTGDRIYTAPRQSGTGYEIPVIADVDHDGHADIIITDDTNSEGSAAVGLQVYNNTDNNWVGTRPIWNEHGYSVSNVDDAGKVPSTVTPSWQGANVFRGNIAHCVPQ